jgi:starvation-inducible outer membrane lipoprotein
MRRCIAITFLFLTVLWTGAPLLACMMPECTMTAQEHECCKHMAQMCGSSNMPQSHSCCKTEVRFGGTMVATSEHHNVPQLQLIATVNDSTEPHFPENLLASRPHHPPGEFLPETTILRI